MNDDFAVSRWSEPRWKGLAPTVGLVPYRGFTLLDNSNPGINHAPVLYIVSGPAGDAILHASPYASNFTATQARFGWLVDNDFRRPPGTRGNLFSREIDEAIAQAQYGECK